MFIDTISFVSHSHFPNDKIYLFKLPNVLSKLQKDRQHNFFFSPILIYKDKNIVTLLQLTSTDSLEYVMLLYSGFSTFYVALKFGFSPTCVFKCLLKPSAWEDTESYWLHLFDHCAFSNVSLNCLHKRMRNYTDSICLTFLHCVFQMFSQVACL